MDIDLMLGSFDLPSDRPHWQAALLAKLSEAPGVGEDLQRQKRLSHLERPRTAVILPFTRPAAT